MGPLQAGQSESQKTDHVDFPLICVGGRYRVGNLLGSGSFGKYSLNMCPFYLSIANIGSVYSGKDVRSGKEVALKVQHHDGPESLSHEYRIYKRLIGCAGIGRAYWYGVEGVYNVLVIDRFEYSVYAVIRSAPLDLHTAVSFGCKMVSTRWEVSIPSVKVYF